MKSESSRPYSSQLVMIWLSHIPPTSAYSPTQQGNNPCLRNFLRGFNEMSSGSNWKPCIHHIIFLPIDHLGIYPFPQRRRSTKSHVPQTSLAFIPAILLPSQPTLSTSPRNQPCALPIRLSMASQNSNQLALLGVCCPILTPLSYHINHSQFKTST